MDLVTVLTLILGNGALIIPLFLWNRAESRADIRYMDAKLDSHIQSTNQIIQAIHAEMKDFHARLCVIEERSKK